MDAIRSVFAQTYTNWELLLVDDGSTDGSLELAQSIVDPRVRVFFDGQNRRLGARLNQITTLARYPYLARMDADDLMARCRIARQMAVLTAQPRVDLVSTGIYSLNDAYVPVGRRSVEINHRVTPRALLAGQSGIVHPSVVARKNWLQRNQYREDVTQCEDTNLWVRAYANSDLHVAIMPDPLYFYREDSNVTLQKLLAGYRGIRITVCQDARSQFSRVERMRAMMYSYAKGGAATVLASVNRLDLLRARRNRSGLSSAEWREVTEEVIAIRQTPLPLVQ